VKTPAGHTTSAKLTQQGRETCVCVLTIRTNGDHLLYQMRYRTGLSPASAEQRFTTVDIEELFTRLRAISEQM
jgi:hypothetical protein